MQRFEWFVYDRQGSALRDLLAGRDDHGARCLVRLLPPLQDVQDDTGGRSERLAGSLLRQLQRASRGVATAMGHAQAVLMVVDTTQYRRLLERYTAARWGGVAEGTVAVSEDQAACAKTGAVLDALNLSSCVVVAKPEGEQGFEGHAASPRIA